MLILAKILIAILPGKVRRAIRGNLRHYARLQNKTAIKLFTIWERAYCA